MDTVTSKDGTTIAFDKQGAGPALLLVDGAAAPVSVPDVPLRPIAASCLAEPARRWPGVWSS